METNFDILGISEGATQQDIREAFRKAALKHHSDRGGRDEQFKRIKQAYEDLKEGKKYPDTEEQRKRRSRVYSGSDEDQLRRRNIMLAAELGRQMMDAQEWIAALNRASSTGTRLFGSKTLGEIEVQRKASGTVLIKGNYMAGRLSYDGPLTVQGNITSPSWSPDHTTILHVLRGDMRMVDPIENGYNIDNGARIVADSGDIIVGNVYGRKDKIQDPQGRIGMYNIKEYRTELCAPNGKIVAANVADTVSLDGHTVISLNLENDVHVRGHKILIYGNKVTYDVRIELVRNGSIRFFENFSVQGLSDDCTITLDNGKAIKMHDLKTKKIRDLPEELTRNTEHARDQTMIGGGFEITYGMLDSMDKKPRRRKWVLGFGK